jgi:predicted PurR-regulated permease PerM
MAEPIQVGGPDRRRLERRITPTLAELTLPELRRMMVTTVLFVIILVLFLWMVRTVIIATILGIIVAMYMRPVFLWLKRYIPNSIAASTLTLTLLIGPVLALTVYSYEEIADVAQYASAHREEIASKIDTSLHRPTVHAGGEHGPGSAPVRDRGVELRHRTFLSSLRQTMASIAVAATIFLFTAYYVMGDAEQIMEYIRTRIPPRYGELSTALEANMRGVLYGAIYSTFLTQTIKSVIILAMNLAFHVPLPGCSRSFRSSSDSSRSSGRGVFIYRLPPGSPVFRNAPGQALAMILIGFVHQHDLHLDLFLRPKIAAERSKVLNFYWMLVALITGVYTFGLVGILLGPMLIGLLKAILDTITSQPGWHWTDYGGDAGRVSASEL